MPIHSHFCGEKLTELSFFSTTIGSDDCECADVGNTDCCADVVIKASLNDQTFQAKQSFTPKRILLPVLPFAVFWEPSLASLNRVAKFGERNSASPPIRKLEPSALQVFRI